MNGNTTDLKHKWEQNKALFEQLCTEQECLYNPEFERVFKALFEIAPEQREVYNTNRWDMMVDLPEAIDTDKINQALAAVGLDEEQGARFTRYAEVTLQGKRLQQQNAILNLAIESENRPPERISPEGWRFYPINIIAPLQMHVPIIEELHRQAQQGEGVFKNLTEIAERPDEALDMFLGVEVYNVSCNYQLFLSELRKYRVTGELLGIDFTHNLFDILNEIANYIKDNTNKPEGIKAHILSIIEGLDKMPIWGLIFQMLILQGLISLLGNCALQKGDEGFNEAQDLCYWLCELLTNKVCKFATVGDLLSDGDLQRLYPLCDYLYNTEIGRTVQECIFKDEATDKEQPDSPEADTLYLPSELYTDRARKYFARAVEVGYMQMTSTGYKWVFGGARGGLVRLGYFVERVYCPTNTEELPEQAINRLFGVSRIGSAITQRHNAKKPQKWRAEIDGKIFFD